MSENSQNQPDPLFVGDDLALDFINTEYGVGARHKDCFVDEQSVVDWLKLAELVPKDFNGVPNGLLKLALALRENARALVTAARAKSAADAGVTNRVLEVGRTRRELQWDSASSKFQVVKQTRNDDAAGLLAPVAEAVVNLLTAKQIDLVRQCEAHDCTLLFHDVTKSHRRRWCSMAMCGNRMKVAAFRSRKKAG